MIWGPLGFRARLAHPWALGPGPQGPPGPGGTILGHFGDQKKSKIPAGRPATETYRKHIKKIALVTFPICLVQHDGKKLRLRGWDLSGEIRAEILRISPPRMSKMVGWRPIWGQKGVILGPLVPGPASTPLGALGPGELPWGPPWAALGALEAPWPWPLRP